MTGSAGGQSVITVISGKVDLNHKKQAGFKVHGRDPSSFSLSQNGSGWRGLQHCPNFNQVGLFEVLPS